MKSLVITASVVGVLLSSCGGNSVASSNGNSSSRNKQLEQACISEDIRPRLKDPQSLRVLNRNSVNAKAVGTYEEGSYTEFAYITYTATNSFGGRIKSTRNCAFIDGTLVAALNGDEDGNPLPFEDSDFVIHRDDLVPD